MATLLVFGMVWVLPGCGGSSSNSNSMTSSGPTLSSIAVTPATQSINSGTTLQYKATGTYSDNSTQDLSALAAWTSSSASVATIATGGLATAVGAGTATITATSGTVSGTAMLTVDVVPVLQSIAVAPPSPAILATATQQFTATGTYSDGSTQNLTSSATWSSSSTSVATIAAGGLATGVAAGTTTITAASGTVSGTTPLTVNAPGGNTSGSTAILVIANPTAAANARSRSHRNAVGPTSSVPFIDAAYQPQSYLTNSSGQYAVQVVNLDTGTSSSALLASIPMPVADSLGNPFVPNATAASQSALKVIVISYTSPDVQVVDAATNAITATYTSPVTQFADFSGGSCMICGALVNPGLSSNQVLLDTAQGYYTMDLGTGAFTALVAANPSENFAFDSTSQVILSPTYTFDGTATEVQLLDLSGNTISSNASLNIIEPDSAAVDLSTGVGVVIDEQGGTQTFINLAQVAVSSGAWTAPTTVYSIPFFAEMTYVAVDSASHTLFTSQEFYNMTAIELLPATAPAGAPPAPTGYVWAYMPNTPDGNGYLNGGDPHGVSIFTSVVDGKLYGFLIDQSQTWVAKIDLAGGLAATQIASPPYPGEIDLTSYTTYLPTNQ
jgi:hypothetical protein